MITEETSEMIPYLDLAAAIVKQAADDYREAHNASNWGEKRKIRKFFKSEYAAAITLGHNFEMLKQLDTELLEADKAAVERDKMKHT